VEAQLLTVSFSSNNKKVVQIKLGLYFITWNNVYNFGKYR